MVAERMIITSFCNFICVGRHCLLLELEPDRSSKVLKDFFCDSHTLVVGIGIDKTMAKLEKENGFLIRRRVELRDLVQAWIDKRAAKLEKENKFLTRRQVDLQDLEVANRGSQRNRTPSRGSELGCDLSRYDARRLARAVLGEEGSLEKPKNVKWLDPYILVETGIAFQ